MLELIAGLATDLQQEFYPQLNSFVVILTSQTLRAKDASIIKWTLRCLAHLLKILWRPISGHLEDVYSSLKVLFELKQPDYIRYLGAETVAFLLRKAKDKRGFLQFILGQITETTDPVAISKLLFESIKTVNQQFNSQLEPSLRIFIDILPGEYDEVLTHFYQFCCDHTTQEHFQPILDITLEFINKNLQDSNDLTVFMDCLNRVIENKQGRLIKHVGKLLDFLKDLINRGCVSDELLNCVTAVIEAYKLPKTDDDHKAAVGLVIDSGFTVDQIMNFVAHFQTETVFESFVLKPYLGWMQRELGNNFETLSQHLADILTERNPACELGSELENFHNSSLDLNLVPSLRKLKKDQLFPNLCISKINVDSSPETIRRSLLICASIYPVDKHQVLENTAALIKKVFYLQNGNFLLVMYYFSSASCISILQDIIFMIFITTLLKFIRIKGTL